MKDWTKKKEKIYIMVFEHFKDTNRYLKYWPIMLKRENINGWD